ncbi:MAG TPA: hypothetical protein VGQ83_40725 [Polyangia bacterium]|jgi:hypothetical protein
MSMRKTGHVVFGCAVALILGGGCGSSTAGVQKDAGADTAPQLDAAQQNDAGPQTDGPACGAFKSLAGCALELKTCTAADVDNSEECGGDLDCVKTELFDQPVCLRKCGCTAECPAETFCYPAKVSDYASTTSYSQWVGKALGHCFWSFCGQAAYASSTLKNGELLGACKLGGEAFIRQGKVDTRDGTCWPIASDWPFGQCFAGGAAPRGGACTFDADTCTDPTTVTGCAPGNICVGRAGEAMGSCAKVCDPSTASFDPSAPGACAGDTNVTHDQYCQDSSTYFRLAPDADGGVGALGELTPAYAGFCTDLHGCDILAAANQCAAVVGDGGVPWNTCEPTTNVDPYGLCSPSGAVAPGGDCDGTNLCGVGYTCIYVNGATQGTCQAYCGLAANGPSDGGVGKHPCPADQFCEQIFTATDPTPETDPNDDPLSLTWGVCVPLPAQTDGGVDANP